ncbi:hypothetical protein K443DRAFT_679244, partial [Laccaria amethystina LaAM-08-1]
MADSLNLLPEKSRERECNVEWENRSRENELKDNNGRDSLNLPRSFIYAPRKRAHSDP